MNKKNLKEKCKKAVNGISPLSAVTLIGACGAVGFAGFKLGEKNTLRKLGWELSVFESIKPGTKQMLIELTDEANKKKLLK